MLSRDDLAQILRRIDGRGYKAYKDIRGAYDFGGLTLFIDHVQGDPFATPSKVRLRMPQSSAELPPALYANPVRNIACADFLAREVNAAIRSRGGSRHGSGKSGEIYIDSGSQEVLERTAVIVNDEWVEARIEVGLPAQGRTVLGREAETLLCDVLPEIAAQGLAWRNLSQHLAHPFVECVENQEHIRAALDERGLVAFVRDGSMLPRESGASDRPLRSENVVSFNSPESLRVTFDVPNPVEGEKTVTGMGIPKGVTLIVGGGYHGKSTLLQAIERGVYPHIPTDGREYVVTSSDAVKIRAEDGRRVEQVDISAFITNLPQAKSTTEFSTDDASGSTSQAASIVEAIEAGCSALLLDEDTSATNFMVRDARMQALVSKSNEPITPFVDRIRELYDRHNVSTVLVMGGCGDYFDMADTVIMMREYEPQDATNDALAVAKEYTTRRTAEMPSPMKNVAARILLAESFNASRGKRDVKIDAKAVDLIVYGRDPIDLRGVEQLADISQTRAIGHAIHFATEQFMDGTQTLRQTVESIDALFDRESLDCLDPYHCPGEHPGNYARPRKYEIAATINRLRTLRCR